MPHLSRRTAIASLFAATLSCGSLCAAGTALADTSGPGTAARKQPRGAKPSRSTGGLKGSLTAEDREINRRCFEKTMREAPTGKTWKWNNPKSGNSGSVTPTSKAARHGDQVCRSFNETVLLKDGRNESISGRACRRSDGSWSIVA